MLNVSNVDRQGIALANSLLDDLIANLTAVCEQNAAYGDPAPVELQDAFQRALCLKSILNDVQPVRNWQMLIETIGFVLEIAERLYSLLNCLKTREGVYEPWDDYKIAANCRWVFAKRVG